jgi:gamma-glutamyl:cysteine ligase YbdK (ATP-grasp superfamily)
MFIKFFQMKRFQAMRDLRLKQWLRGDRKGLYESVDQLMDEVKPDRGGMGRTRATEAAKAAAAKAAQEQQQETNAQTEAKN